mmetsp:Transcript_7586/g.10417  ORF Transcript_7586/g.10417 Transcript_7586/m.10417 type:complete len:234 (-) Transcript_7586:72-773(-)
MGSSQGQKIEFEADVQHTKPSSKPLFQCCNICRRDDTLQKTPVIISRSESPGLSPGKIYGFRGSIQTLEGSLIFASSKNHLAQRRDSSANINDAEALESNIDPDFADLGRELHPTLEAGEREARMKIYLEKLGDESVDSKLRPGRASVPTRGLPRPEKDVLSARDVARILRDPGGVGSTVSATSSAFTSLDPLARKSRRGGQNVTASQGDQKNTSNSKTSTATSDESITERWQ